MKDIPLFEHLSFYKVDKYIYSRETVCDFTDCPRPHYCLGYILKGSAVFTFDDCKVNVNKGDMIFVPVSSRYKSVWQGEPTVEYISFHFSFAPPSLFKRERKYSIQKLSTKNDKLRESFLSAYELSNSCTADRLLSLSHFFGVLGTIYPMLQYSESQRIDPRIKKAVDYLETNCTARLTVPQLAGYVHMSESHFYSCFKSALGVSPIEYRHRVLINRAMLMLIKDEQMPIEEISDSLGFGSAIHFRRVFKNHVGISPTAYRKSGKKQQ